MQRKLWTIGHSTRSIAEFIALLKAYKIALLVDVRSIPGSRKFPQFNQENLRESLAEAQIGYQHAAGLGGLRKKHPHSRHTAWRNPSFRAYADYMETASFIESAAQLMQLATEARVCICCSEVLWWRCHRSMIADYLKSKGWRVYHIMGPAKAAEHRYTQPAQIQKGTLTYGSQVEPNDPPDQ